MITKLLMDDLSKHVSDQIVQKLHVAVEEFVASYEIRGGYMPACATFLRIIADELADRFPDDTNGGRTE